VIIPTLDEQQSIAEVLSAIPTSTVDEVLVVDGSSDRTAEIAESLGARVLYESRRGYGRALQTAIENVLGDIVVYMDGDFTYDPSEIRRLVQPVRNGTCDVMLGNRLKRRTSYTNMPFLNRIGNRVLSAFFSLIFRVNLGDTQCGLRVLRRSPLLNHAYRSYGMAYVTEQLARLAKAGYRIAEVPVNYRRRIGKSKLRRFRDGFDILWTILRVRLQS
jgi:dolichol-phosphate mannosyltransferase